MKKKILLTALCIMLIASAAICFIPTGAAERYETVTVDFNSMTAGEVPTGSWNITNANGNTTYAKVISGSRTEPPKGLKIYDNSETAGPERAYYKFDPINGAATISFGYFLGSIGANSAHEIILFNGNAQTENLKLAVRFYPKGDGTAVFEYSTSISTYKTTSYTVSPLFNWYSIAITLYDDNTADISIGGTKVAERVKCVDRNASFDRISFQTYNRAGTGDLYWIDDLKITAGDTTIINESFEKATIGELPVGWTTEQSSTDIGACVGGFFNPVGNYLEVGDTASNLGPVSAQLKIEKTNLSTVSFAYAPRTSDTSGVDVIKLSNGGVAMQNCLIELQVWHNGGNSNDLKYYIHSPKETVDTGLNLKQNQYYLFRIAMPADFANENAKLYVNDVFICEIPLRNTATYGNYDTIAFETWNARGVNAFHIDSINIERYVMENVMNESLNSISAGRFSFDFSTDDLTAVRFGLLSGGNSALTIECDDEGAMYWTRGDKLIKFTPAGIVKTNVTHKIEIDMPEGRNVDYFRVYVDGEYVGMALYDVAFEKVDCFKVEAEIGAGVSASNFKVSESEGIKERKETAEKTLDVYLSEIVSAKVGYKGSDASPSTGALGNFGANASISINGRNSIGVDLGAKQKLNAIRISTSKTDKISVDTRNYSVWYSNDNAAYTQIKGFSLNSFTENGVMVMLFEFSGVEARYFKVNTTLGETDEPNTITIDSLSLNVRAERRIDRLYPMAGQIMERLNDTTPTSGAMTRVFKQTEFTLTKGVSLGINFGVNSNVEAIELKGGDVDKLGYGDFELYYSNDNVTYTKIEAPIISYGEDSVRLCFANIKCGYIKLHIMGDISISTSHADIKAYSSVEIESGLSRNAAGVSRGAEGSFSTLPDGTMLMTYNHPTDLSSAVTDNSPMAIFTVKSYDGGYTWDKANTYLTIPVPEGAVNVGQSTYMWMENGDLAIIYRTIEIAQQQKNVYIQRSDDGGVTWGDPVRVSAWDEQRYSVISSGNRAYRLSNGRILMAVNQDSDYNDAWGGDRAVSVVWYSDDDGYSWTRSKDVVTVPTAALEPTLACLPDGSLLMSIRTRTVGRIYQSVSYDNGETWTQAEMVTDNSEDGYLDSPSSTNALLTLPTGDVALFWNNVWSDANEPRTPLSVGVTVDNGESYSNVRNLVETTGSAVAWPSVAAYGRAVYVQTNMNITSVRIFDVSELYHPLSGANTIADLPKAATPSAVYNEATKTLSNLNTDMAFSLDGGESWIFAGGSEVVFEQSHIAKARKILVKNVGNTEYAPSDIQELEAHDFVGDTCQKCGATCPHELVDGVCKYCGTSCVHKFSFSIYTGLYSCDVCGELCKHSSFTNDLCNACGIKCVHDWKYAGNTSSCVICKKICTNHEDLGLDFKCKVCGVDTGKSNSFNVGASFVYDNYFTLEKYHNASVSFDFTVGEAYYDKSTEPNNTSDYHSLLTFIRNNAEYHVFASLWMDQESGKLYLTKGGSSETKICEIEQGAKYGINIDFKPKSGGAYTVTVTKDGAVIGTLNNAFGGFSTTQKSAWLRFGEAVNAKYLRVNNVAFDNIEITTEPYANGICTECGIECNHVYNIGGHCHICGVLGDPITFKDGKNGGGNVVDTVKNAQSLTVGNGVYSQNNGEYRQCWDFRDTEGILLGHDYVFEGKFTFNEFVHDPNSKNGITNLLIWSNGDVGVDNNKFFVLLYTDNGKLELGVSAAERMELELGKEYDIRVAIRSDKLSDNSYSNRAEIYVNGKLMWTKSFALTADNGMSIRLGDHVARTSKVKYDVKNDFGIHFIDSSIEYVGSQEKENANYNYDSSYDIRFIFGIDDLYLDDVGVKVEAEVSGGSMYDEVSGEMTISSSRTVLTEIMADGKVCKPVVNGAGGGNYLALAINDIPLDTGATYTFTLTPYVTYNTEETVFSKDSHKITVSFTDYKMNIAYEK